MKKRFVGLILSLAMALTTVVVPIGASAEEYDDFSYEISDGGVTITKFNGSAKSVEIPSEIDGYPVTSIGDNAFEECSNIESITIPVSVESIGYSAFAYCRSLKNIKIPYDVKRIDEFAFDNCNSLTSITVDENNNYYCDIDGNLYNKNKTTLIQYAIGKKDKYFTIPKGVTSIGSYAFERCSGLESITIPDSVTSICDLAFYKCINLTSITILNSETDMDSYAFGGVPSTCVAYVPDGFDKSKMTNAGYTGKFDTLIIIEVKDGKAYALKDNNTATMRFMWETEFEDDTIIEKVGAYVIPWSDFTDITTDSRTKSVQYANPKTADGQNMQSGNTFGVDISNIPSENYDTVIYAIPFVNGSIFADKMVNKSVNDADINK